MTFTNIRNNQAEAVRAFQQFGVDDQLALLWYLYTDMRDQITPSPNSNETGFDIAKSWYDRLKQMSQEQQLQAQREIAGRKETEISREYGALDSSTKLMFWYLLGRGIDSGEIVAVPSNYQMSNSAQQFLNEAKQMDFNDQITFARSVVLPMGFGSPQQTQI